MGGALEYIEKHADRAVFFPFLLLAPSSVLCTTLLPPHLLPHTQAVFTTHSLFYPRYHQSHLRHGWRSFEPPCQSPQPKSTARADTPNGCKYFAPGACMGVMAAAASHCAAYRASRIKDMRRRAGATMLDAFVAATPLNDQAAARSRTALAVNKKIKSIRAKYMSTLDALKATVMSAAESEDLVITFGGAVLLDLARQAFKKSHVTSQLTVRKPVDLAAAGPPTVSLDCLAPDTGASHTTQAALSTEGEAWGAESGSEGGSTPSDGSDGSVSDTEGTQGPSTDTGGSRGKRPETASQIAARDSPPKNAKKGTAAGILRDYLNQKLRTGAASGAAGGATDGDVRQALVNMMNV